VFPSFCHRHHLCRIRYPRRSHQYTSHLPCHDLSLLPHQPTKHNHSTTHCITRRTPPIDPRVQCDQRRQVCSKHIRCLKRISTTTIRVPATRLTRTRRPCGAHQSGRQAVDVTPSARCCGWTIRRARRGRLAATFGVQVQCRLEMCRRCRRCPHGHNVTQRGVRSNRPTPSMTA
jgi:hypothetical protein